MTFMGWLAATLILAFLLFAISAMLNVMGDYDE